MHFRSIVRKPVVAFRSPPSEVLRLLWGAGISAHERKPNTPPAHEYFLTCHDERQLVRLGISLQRSQELTRFAKHAVTELALIQ